MSVPSSVSSDVRVGARIGAQVVGRSLNAMDADRGGALLAALAMSVILLFPWYDVTATAAGADGSRHVLRQSLSGWGSLSLPAVVGALAALAVVLVVLVRTGVAVEGLGARSRRLARTRVDGRLIAAAGALAVLALLVGLAVHPGPRPALPGATAAVSVRFGFGLALLDAILITALGARVALRGGDRETATSRPASPRRGQAPRRRPIAHRTHAGDPTTRTDVVSDRRSR